MLHQATKRLSESSKEVFRLAKAKAETERAYRSELAKVMTAMRMDKVPIGVIGDLARGEIADLKFERDLASETYRAALSAMEALKVEINALQSIAKYQSEI
ncbi:hypothetical protein [Planococcus chinensis]|uniref:hypothetical protein n=1 Tax=Planococcus chinensis TaxID=272917 RepID=UPI001CC58BB5|nr:hypothetical protein [Planococcus chinensis]